MSAVPVKPSRTQISGEVEIIVDPACTQRDQRRTNRKLDAGCVHPHWKPKGKGENFE